MSFFLNSLVRTFLAERAIHLVSNEIRNEIRAVNAEPIHHRTVDFALLFSGKSELNAFLDLCDRTSTTKGGSVTFHQTVKNEKKVVFVDVASDPVKVTETVLGIFRPQRVISAGFAKSLQPNMKNRIFIPHRIIAAQSPCSCLDLWNPSLIEGPKSKNDISKNDTKNDFCPGILCSGRPTQKLLDQYAPFAVDDSTYLVVDTCRKKSVPCFPLKIITSQYDHKNEVSAHHGFARKFGLFLNKTLSNPKYALQSFGQHMEYLESGDVLAKKVIQLFFQNISSEIKGHDV